MNPIVFDVLIAVGLLAGLAVALELGFRCGRRTAAENDPRAGSQIGAIQGAVLGLLGLLLGFSFSAAGSRFLERQDLIVQQANAIGTAYLRADLLDEPQRSALRSSLKEYTEFIIDTSSALNRGLPPGAAPEIERRHAGIWNAASSGVLAKPAVTLAVLPPVNEVIDLHSLRLAAAAKHVPYLVLGLLVACSLLSIGVIGYGCGTSSCRRTPLTISLLLVVGAALYITIDLDRPRTGFIQLSDAPLKALQFEHDARSTGQ